MLFSNLNCFSGDFRHYINRIKFRTDSDTEQETATAAARNERCDHYLCLSTSADTALTAELFPSISLAGNSSRSRKANHSRSMEFTVYKRHVWWWNVFIVQVEAIARSSSHLVFRFICNSSNFITEMDTKQLVNQIQIRELHCFLFISFLRIFRKQWFWYRCVRWRMRIPDTPMTIRSTMARCRQHIRLTHGPCLCQSMRKCSTTSRRPFQLLSRPMWMCQCEWIRSISTLQRKINKTLFYIHSQTSTVPSLWNCRSSDRRWRPK